jgi:hypothetical protein
MLLAKRIVRHPFAIPRRANRSLHCRRGVFPHEKTTAEIFAPGKPGYSLFLKAAPTVNVAQGEAFRPIKAISSKATIGSARRHIRKPAVRPIRRTFSRTTVSRPGHHKLFAA